MYENTGLPHALSRWVIITSITKTLCVEDFWICVRKEHIHRELLWWWWFFMDTQLIFFFFFFTATPVAYGSCWARYWIWATAWTYTEAVATLDSWTHCTRRRIELNLCLCGNPSHCSRLLSPLCHSRNSSHCCFSCLLVFFLFSFSCQFRSSGNWLES